MRTLLLRDEAHELLRDEYANIADIFYYADKRNKERIQADLADGDSVQHPSVIAMNMWHYATNRAIQIYRDRTDVVPSIFNQTFGLLFMDVLFIKLKKLDEEYMTSNFMTKQALAILSQQIIHGFPDKPCFLNAGYKMNRTETEIESINITCTSSKKKKVELLWRINLDDYNEGSLPVIPFAPTPDEPVSPSIEKLLQIKADRRKKGSGTTN